MEGKCHPEWSSSSRMEQQNVTTSWVSEWSDGRRVDWMSRFGSSGMVWMTGWAAAPSFSALSRRSEPGLVILCPHLSFHVQTHHSVPELWHGFKHPFGSRSLAQLSNGQLPTSWLFSSLCSSRSSLLWAPKKNHVIRHNCTQRRTSVSHENIWDNDYCIVGSKHRYVWSTRCRTSYSRCIISCSHG